MLTLKEHTGQVSSVSFSPDGKRLASASDDYTVKLWDATTGQEMLTLKGHSHWVVEVGFSPDGRRLASASVDNTVKLWDATTGLEMLTLKGHTDIVTSVSFSPDGKKIISRDRQNYLKVWSVESGMELPLDSIKDLSAIDQKPILTSPDGKFTIEINDSEVYIIHNQYRQERIARDRQRLAEWSRPNPQWHLDQAKESESAKLPFSTAFHLAWARRGGAWQHQVTMDLWKNLQATWPSPARDKLQAQVLGEDVGRMILAGTSAAQGNWAPTFFSTRFIFN
jgi:dipeptidyl aminopeptidase/acylaminoacyl peptidase